jgi:hypothetical protein
MSQVIEAGNSNNMQIHHDTFIASLMLLLNLIKEKSPSKEVCGRDMQSDAKKLLDAFDTKKIDVIGEGNFIKKAYFVLSSNVQLLKYKDEKLFQIKDLKGGKQVLVTIIPGIDLNRLWPHVKEHHKAMWRYLSFMYVSSVRMINMVNETALSPSDVEMISYFESDLATGENLITEFWNTFPNTTVLVKEQFNPYVGVGVNSQEYGVDQMFSGPKLLADQAAPGVSSMAKMLGIDKMINMDDLSNQLKNISKKDIDDATANIKTLLGNDIDQGTTNMIADMLNDITDELKNENVAKGDALDNIVKIAESVAQKMMPKIDKNQIDMKKVWNSTKNLADNYKDKDGKPMFAGNSNPLAMLTGFMDSQMKMGKSKQDKVSKAKNDDAMQQCQDMLAKMGINDMDLNQLKNMPLSQLTDLSSTNASESEGASKSSKRKNKK